MKNYLFVYGTLKRNQKNHLMIGDCEFVGNGVALGFALLSLGSFPGMVPASDNYHTIGEVYEIPKDYLNQTLVMLDRFEHSNTLYRRVKIPVILVSGELVECFTYLFILKFNHQVYPNGEFE